MSKTLLETIKCLDGEPYHLAYHQNRVNYSRKILNYHSPLTLKLNPPKKGLYRCRIIYNEEIIKIEYLPYQYQNINVFKLVSTSIEYALKYEDLSEINALLSHESDEIILIKKGLVTDTSIANICFFNGKEWLTPKKPLLKGTTRQRLLDEKRLIEADILATNIHKYKKIALCNAMIDFAIIENAIIS